MKTGFENVFDIAFMLDCLCVFN